MRSFFVFLCLIFSALPVFAVEDLCQTQNCIGVVDVGSTGSRLFLYTYDRDEAGYPIHIQEQWSKKVTPGLATLDLQQETIDTYLDELFATPMNSKIPVYVYATAGMRLRSNAKQQAYYRAVEQWFNTHPTPWTLVEAKTITGKEEGVYGWLAVNYKIDSFSDESAERVGVMDTGGASVQVVFPVSEAITLSSAYSENVTIYGKTYTLYAYSALGLGQTLVAQQFLNHSACYPRDYLLADKEKASGDAFSCVKDIAHLVNDVHHVSEEVSPLVSRKTRDWYAMGGVTYIARSTLFNFNDSFMPEQLLQAAQQKACSRSWSEVVADAPNDADMACLMGSYYYALMVEGYGISTNDTLNLMPDAGWTLGVVLSLRADLQ